MWVRNTFGLGLAAAAAVTAGAADAAPGVEIANAVARVTVIPEARADVAVSVVKANPHLPLKISRQGDKVIVDGGLGWRSPNCHTLGGRPGAFVWGVGAVGFNDMPQVVVRVPRQATVAAGGAVFGTIGGADGVDLANSGCGDWTVADQAGPLRVRVSGSGDVYAGSAGSADVEVSGSGDVRVKVLRNGLTAGVVGSGNVEAASVNGPLRVRVAGSGDVEVHGGAVSDMDVSVSGSGDVRFGGVAGALEARVAGSGDISVARVTGPVSKHVAGSGDVSIGH